MQKKAFSRVGVKVWNEMPDEYKVVKEILQKWNKKSSS